MTLSTNMRTLLTDDSDSAQFAALLLAVGSGSVTNINSQNILVDHRYGHVVHTIDDLIQKIYEDVQTILNKTHSWFCERVILSPKNNVVDEINHQILQRFQAETKEYRSFDTVLNDDESVHYPSEFLNSLNSAGLPQHILNLKIGTPIILLRNLNAPKLCNGTRLQIIKFANNILHTRILTGPASGENALIPRIPMIPSDLPFQFKRL